MKCFGTKVNRIFLSQRLMGSQEEVELFILLFTDLGLNPPKKLAASPDLVTLWFW